MSVGPQSKEKHPSGVTQKKRGVAMQRRESPQSPEAGRRECSPANTLILDF